MTIPTAGGPWTAMLLIGAYTTVALAFVPHAVTATTRHRRTARAIRPTRPHAPPMTSHTPDQGDDHMTAQNLDAINRTLTPPTPEILRRLRDALTRLGPTDPADYWPDDQGDPVTTPTADELLTQASAELLGIVSDDTDTEHALAELHAATNQPVDGESAP